MSSESRDAVATAPHVYTVLFENERIRLLEITMNPGTRSDLHEHPDNVVYMVTGGNVKFSLPDGTSVDAELHPGQAVWQQAGSHAVDNTGRNELKAVMVELKG